MDATNLGHCTIWFITVKQVQNYVSVSKWLFFCTIFLIYVQWPADHLKGGCQRVQSWYIYLQAESVEKGNSALDSFLFCFEQSPKSTLKIYNVQLQGFRLVTDPLHIELFSLGNVLWLKDHLLELCCNLLWQEMWRGLENWDSNITQQLDHPAALLVSWR